MAVVAVALVAEACKVGVLTPKNCGSDTCCCEYGIDSNTTVWSCYASDVCQHLNGTCGGGNGGSCPNGEVQTQTCSGVASCCCSYQYTGSDATVCTSEAVCTQLGGSC